MPESRLFCRGVMLSPAFNTHDRARSQRKKNPGWFILSRLPSILATELGAYRSNPRRVHHSLAPMKRLFDSLWCSKSLCPLFISSPFDSNFRVAWLLNCSCTPNDIHADDIQGVVGYYIPGSPCRLTRHN